MSAPRARVPWRRFVALGDSFTEGVGDPDKNRPHQVRGWADRVADVLAGHEPGLGYANLAIRGRKLVSIMTEQLEPAIELEPDLVTLYAGANDLMRPRVDVPALLATYDEGVGRLAATGATVLLFTPFNPGHTVMHKPLAGRWHALQEGVRATAERHSATVVDYWSMHHFRDWSLWSPDRLHMNARGHQRMAMEVLDVLGVPHGLNPADVGPGPPQLGRVAWASEHLVPWVGRRVTGQSSGDGLSPRRPAVEPPL